MIEWLPIEEIPLGVKVLLYRECTDSYHIGKILEHSEGAYAGFTKYAILTKP